MFRKATEFIINKQIERKLKQYDIRLVHHIPGRIRLQSPRWVNNSELVGRIVYELQSQPIIYNVQSTLITGSLLITYDAQVEANVQDLELWIQILDQVYAAEKSKSKG